MSRGVIPIGLLVSAVALAAGYELLTGETVPAPIFLSGMAFVFVVLLAGTLIPEARQESTGTLHGAQTVSLGLEHPYLEIRASITAGGRITILIDGTAPDVAIAARNGRELDGLEQRTGDKPFDAKVKVTGSSVTCRSLFDANRRAVVQQALEEYPALVVRNGQLIWSGQIAESAIPRTAQKLLDLAAELLSPDLISGLEKNVLDDKNPSMRIRAIALLVSRFKNAPETRRIAAAALTDTDPDVRLHASRFLGTEGHDVLAALASDEALPPRIRAEAIHACKELPHERLSAILLDALKDRREAVRIAAVFTIKEQKIASCNGRLALIFSRATPALQAAIVDAAAATNDVSAEGPLLAALEVQEPATKLAAVKALGPIGTVRAVEKLLPIRDQPLGGELARTAGTAIAAIQSRLVGAGAGQLAITEGSPGEVSFPPAEAGSLTVPDHQPGELAVVDAPNAGARRRTTT